MADKLPVIFDRLPHDQNRKDIRLFLLLFGRLKAFTSLDQDGRSEAFLKMEGHPLSLVRGGARALKTLVGFLWASTEDAAEVLISWEAMGYPGPDGPPPATAKPITPVTISSDTEMTCDVVIIGSGAGDGTAAGILTMSGLDVVVLEAGGYRSESDFTHLEADAYRDMYLDKVLGSTADGGIAILAGSTLGGGTVINYTTSFSTPQAVREEWDQVSGFDDVFTGAVYATSIERVRERLNVNQDHGWPSTRATLMEKGLRDLGWHVDEMPRNVDGCTTQDCGYCTLGCRIGAKRSTPPHVLAGRRRPRSPNRHQCVCRNGVH